MTQITELEKQVLKQEYPQLSLSDDLDIERYFELRKKGFLREALLLYNGKLKIKYPDEKMRIELMSCYRRHSPRFQELLTQNLVKLAQKTISQIKQIIEFISTRISNLDENDVYNVIQRCEQIVSAISNDRFAAISFMQKISRYAVILNFQPEAMKKSAELIRLYVTDTLSSVNEYKAEQAALASKENRHIVKYRPAPAFDFSKIIFTKEQREAIIIPDTVKSVEDKVIAYTVKYWASYSNAAFENAVLLFSRKYKTNHYNIFQAVKIGRYRDWKDEEILQAVLSNVVNGYYYSISGDLYLQRQWAKTKLSLVPNKKNISQQAENSQEQKSLPPVPNKKKPDEKVIKNKTTKIINLEQPDTKDRIDKDIISNKKFVEEPNKEKDVKLDKPEISVPHSSEVKTSASIAELIKLMTGANYKIHKGMFFDTIRTAIRNELDKRSIQTTSIFKNEYIDAENLIYEFFEKNYENPFQDWRTSEQCAEVLKLGFDLQSIESIIKEWTNI